jgi:RimJ/RimL family protein N-acetyltransferase
MIEPATPSDVPAILEIERGDGFDRQVGRWPAEQHVAEMSKAGSAYFVWREGGKVIGFVMLQEIDAANRSAYVRRIAVREPGRGAGRALLGAALTHCFETLGMHRVDLKVLTDNLRARRAYTGLGFTEEGILRDVHRDADGSFRSMAVMSILRPEWEAGRP